MLERVGLGDRLRHFPHELSGGEQQRVAIARALASGNPTLLADEPTGELDFRTGIQILELLHAQAHTRRAVVVVTHNREIARVADRVIELSSGRVVATARRGRPGRDRRPALVSDGPTAQGRLWIRWALRDARRHRWQVLSIALLLALGVGMYAAMSSMSVWRVDSADSSFAALRMHDLRVSLVEGSTARARARCGRPWRAQRRRADVAAAAERLVVPNAGRRLHGRADDHRPGADRRDAAGADVDTLDVRAGRLPAAGGRPAVALEHNFARHYDLPAARGADARGGQRDVRRPGARARVLHRHRAGRRLRRRGGVRRRLRPPADRPDAGRAARPGQPARRAPAPGRRPRRRARQLARALTRRCRHRGGFTVTGRDQEPAHRLIYKDAEGDQEMLDIFAFLILGGATFAAFNLIAASSRRSGARSASAWRWGCVRSGWLFAPYSSARRSRSWARALGLLIGLWASGLFRGALEGLLPLPVYRTPFEPAVFVGARCSGSSCPSSRPRSRSGERCACSRSRRSASASARPRAAASRPAPSACASLAGRSRRCRSATPFARRAEPR